MLPPSLTTARISPPGEPGLNKVNMDYEILFGP